MERVWNPRLKVHGSPSVQGNVYADSSSNEPAGF